MMAQPRYYTEDQMAERQPLSHPNPPSPRRNHYPQDPYTPSPPRTRPGAHPDSSFNHLQHQRRLSQEPAGRGPYAMTADNYGGYGQQNEYSPPKPPPHRNNTDGRSWGNQAGYPPQRPMPQSNVTPGADNFSSAAAAGGMAGVAMNVADQNTRDPHYPQQTYRQQGQWQEEGQGHGERGRLGPGGHPGEGWSSRSSSQAAHHNHQRDTTPSRSPYGFAADPYTDDPSQVYIRPSDPNLGVVNPLEIEDDGDDGLHYGPKKGPRTSMLSLGSSHRSGPGAAAAAGGVAGSAIAAGAISGLTSRNGSGDVNNRYAPVNNVGDASSGSGRGIGGYDHVYNEKQAPKRNGKKWRLAIIIIIAILAIVGIVLGVLFGAVFKKSGGDPASGRPGASAEDDFANNGDLNINSAEIKALMGNTKLKKVFPGMDYTPIHSQYPDCIKFPPSQNNVTRDLAVLSRLTNVVRLYGTDCNQTQMLIHAVDQLKLKNDVKIWLGVWQDANSTTNKRQLDQMWDILDQYGDSYFKGIIVANEILFREQMTLTALGSLLAEVRTNLTAKGLSLPVATSDLGDKWDSSLAAQSDAIMGNIHPFFAGEPARNAANWTLTFWENKAGTFLKKDKSMNIISEIGWPSKGGMGCGNAFETDCPQKAVAGVKEMNELLGDWVCRALDEDINYFWFSAFDEPWKIAFNEKGKEWEDQWGLMDVNRNLKPGVTIPDCGGRRVG